MKYKNIINSRLLEIRLLAVIPTQLKLRKESRQNSSFQNFLFFMVFKFSPINYRKRRPGADVTHLITVLLCFVEHSE
jgi:hypothetical protein